MTAIDTLRRLAMLVVLSLAQALVFNHIRLFGCAMPLLYVYFVIAIPRGYPRWATLLWSFTLGLTVDLLSNTPGAAAGALTFVGLLQPYLVELFLPREAAPNLKVSVAGMGRMKFLVLAAILTFIHCLAFYSLEMFSFVDWRLWALCVAGSVVLTLVLLMALESVRKS